MSKEVCVLVRNESKEFLAFKNEFKSQLKPVSRENQIPIETEHKEAASESRQRPKGFECELRRVSILSRSTGVQTSFGRLVTRCLISVPVPDGFWK